MNKKRRIFDAGRQRATDSDVPYKATRKTAQVIELEHVNCSSTIVLDLQWRNSRTG